ncbi:MAG: hypothetical protein ABI203_03775 [Mucilaginibacter sp.]
MDTNIFRYFDDIPTKEVAPGSAWRQSPYRLQADRYIQSCKGRLQAFVNREIAVVCL